MNLANFGLQMLLGIIWGASFMFIKVGVAEIGSFTFPWLRVLIAAIVLYIVIRARGKTLPRDWRTWRLFAVQGTLGIALPFAALAWGSQYIPSGLSAILNATMPMFTYMIAVLSGSEKLRVGSAVGLLIGLVGILVLTLPKLQAGMQASLWGQLAVIAGSLSYALAAVFARRRLTGQPGEFSSFGMLTVSFLLLTPLALAQRPWTIQPSAGAITSLLVLSIVGTGLAYLIYFRLIRAVGATGTSLVTYISPVFSIFWGWVILRERLSWHAFVAFGLILVGLLLVNDMARRFPALVTRLRAHHPADGA